MEVGMEFHVAGELKLKARRPKSVDIMVHGEVVGLKNGELVMGHGWYMWYTYSKTCRH